MKNLFDCFCHCDEWSEATTKKQSFNIYMSKQPTVYILTNKANGILYTGVTSNLVKRIYEHKQNNSKGFTYKYNCKLLVYYEIFDEMYNAIEREKQLKAGSSK